MKQSLTIGTRGSKLALWQANWVKATLEKIHPALDVELLIIKTKGDKILDVPLAKVGGKGLFVKEIEEALLDGRIDLAVHSMKDMPAELPDGLTIGAVPERETPWDVLISRNNCTVTDLPKGARIGTSSLRRSSQLLHSRPDLEIVSLRGNLDTRIKKLTSENLDAIVLAAAGVKRLSYEHHISEYIPKDTMLPAVGQGALCIETRLNDPDIAPLTAAMEHRDTRVAVTGERAFLHKLEGGCQVPIAAYGEVHGDRLTLTGMVADLDGGIVIKESVSGTAKQALPLGVQLAERLLALGAGSILEKLAESPHP
jgi:hydroxymethylbilane synthase